MLHGDQTSPAMSTQMLTCDLFALANLVVLGFELYGLYTVSVQFCKQKQRGLRELLFAK